MLVIPVRVTGKFYKNNIDKKEDIMASIIDNRSKTMLDSLKNSLKQAESVDILTAFFYFSGFNALAEDL